MNKFKYYFILLVATISLFSCSKNDTPTAEPLRDYSVQYATDIATIEEFLKTNYITVVEHPGFQDDQDVVFTKISDGGTQPSIYSYLNSATYPKLLSRNVSQNEITYKLYYLVLREGTGITPCNVDGVLTSYSGKYLSSTTASGVTTQTTTQFEEVKFPSQVLSLVSTIKGWSEAFPQFKTGTSASNSDGTVTHTNFGSGVLFIPSGLAYYASGAGAIPAYTSLIFSIKLYDINRLDQDLNRGLLAPDGILSYQEDINRDGYVYVLATGVVNPDDTDGDEIPDFLDVDDDGDKYTTLLERKYTDSNGVTQYYDFASIPLCTGGNGKKRYLDATCHD